MTLQQLPELFPCREQRATAAAPHRGPVIRRLVKDNSRRRVVLTQSGIGVLRAAMGATGLSARRSWMRLTPAAPFVSGPAENARGDYPTCGKVKLASAY